MKRKSKSPSKTTPRSDGPELFIALVGAVGTDLEVVSTTLCDSLREFNYVCDEPIRFSQLLHEITNLDTRLIDAPEDQRIISHMDAGNEFRGKMERGDALALLAISAIRALRESKMKDFNRPIPRQAYIFKSLKHPDEVQTLRKIYGSGFFLISAYSPRRTRIENLSKNIAGSHHKPRSEEYHINAEQLNQRDEFESENKFGQNVRETFPEADIFINTSDKGELQGSVKRFVELLFGNTFRNAFHTPTRHEYGMFHAKGAALRSASLSRQVGAVISTIDGDIIAVGTNEVPKYGGGLYWSGDTPDHRDHALAYDSSDKMKNNLLVDILERFKKGDWFKKEIVQKTINDLLLKAKTEVMRDAQIMNVIEYSRAVHAEMAAIVDAARRGVAIEGGNLYTTTFPCHDCAKHIVAAGVKKVVYIEPYPKSLTSELYPDSIAVDEPGGGRDKVSFEPFVGIAPRLYMNLFSMDGVKRKDKDGKVIETNKTEAIPRFTEIPPASYLLREAEEITRFQQLMQEKGLSVRDN